MSEIEQQITQEITEENSSEWLSSYKPTTETLGTRIPENEIPEVIDSAIQSWILNPSKDALDLLRAAISQPGGMESLVERMGRVKSSVQK